MESIYKNGETIIKFDDIEIEKQKFHKHKRPNSIKNTDVNKVLATYKTSFNKIRFKYFIGFK